MGEPVISSSPGAPVDAHTVTGSPRHWTSATVDVAPRGSNPMPPVSPGAPLDSIGGPSVRISRPAPGSVAGNAGCHGVSRSSPMARRQVVPASASTISCSSSDAAVAERGIDQLADGAIARDRRPAGTGSAAGSPGADSMFGTTSTRMSPVPAQAAATTSARSVGRTPTIDRSASADGPPCVERIVRVSG